MPTISRRLASAGTADSGDLKSPSLPGASSGSSISLRSSSYVLASRRVVNREQQTGSTQDRTALGVQVSPRRPIWNVNRPCENFECRGLLRQNRSPKVLFIQARAFAQIERHFIALLREGEPQTIKVYASNQVQMEQESLFIEPFAFGRLGKVD